MIGCMRLIIGEVGTREREREGGSPGLKIGRSKRDLNPVQGPLRSYLRSAAQGHALRPRVSVSPFFVVVMNSKNGVLFRLSAKYKSGHVAKRGD